ncbi:MAG: helix-turn-helix transcriptional regulator [Meiothermus sp.]|nr:helix-turn-helix transcriptional regulator [Meiothermus sp.]
MPKPRRTDFNGPLAAEIRAAMADRGWTKLEQFADAHGIGRTTVYNLVFGRTNPGGTRANPSAKTLAALSAALNRPAEELLDKLQLGAGRKA